MIEINGMAHVILTVSQFDKAHKFYSGLLPEFGMTKVEDGPRLPLSRRRSHSHWCTQVVTQNLQAKRSNNTV